MPDREAGHDLRPDLVLAGFAEALRHAGVPVTSDRLQLFLAAVAALDAGRAADVYWAGRAALCTGPDDADRYDELFALWFSGEPPGSHRRQRTADQVATVGVHAGPAAAGARDAGARPDQVLPTRAADTDLLRHRDVAELSAAERAEVARQLATLRPRLPVRRSARRRPSRRGRPDPRRTLRAQLRQAGEPARIRYRRRTTRARPLVVLVDVSGSMAPYADSLVRLAHTLAQAPPSRSGPRRVEVFTVGTRLTRVTPALRHRDTERALRAAGDVVPDWSGGTRLGQVLKVFLDRWGQRGLARGAVVVLCSDGWERGDARQLGEQMRRLAGLAHRVVWLNPHRGKAGYRPVQAGIVAALPYVDELVAGHSLAAFADLLEVVADA